MFILQRRIAKLYVKHLQESRQFTHFSTEQLLSEENREKCLNCWSRSPHQTNAFLKSYHDKSASENNSSSAGLAAVLVPVCVDDKGEISLLYTRRSAKLKEHVRQISFPGGKMDKKDGSFENCVLRETEEEIGLSRKRVKIWGSGDVIKPPNRDPIVPVIGIIENFSLNNLKINKAEVEEAFTVPIKTLCSEDVMKYTQFRTGYSLPAFQVDTMRRIWGITAVITRTFLNCFLPNNVYKHRIEFIKPYNLEK